MANLSEDIQCAGSDTRPPMLDRTDFASWQQRIRLYCRGKKNVVNILKSIDEGTFQMGTFRETLAEGNKGALHLGPERPRVYSVLSPEDKERKSLEYYKINDEAPTAQTMFMANLSSADPVYDEAGRSYDFDIFYMSNSNMIPHDQYVKDNAVPIVQSNVSSVTNDAYMMIYNYMYEPHAQSVSKITWNIVVDNSLTTELETYKEQVELYERRARFGLTKREQKIDEQIKNKHFEGIQKALTKEVKEMKEIFEELEAEVEKHVVDRKHDEIERKNLLIANDN
ncbi:hypothetical protein Tco_1268279 [Tanacetum coccineum]